MCGEMEPLEYKDSKICAKLQFVSSQIFFTHFQDHEEPESKMKVFTSSPVLLIDSQMITMLIKKSVIFKTISLLEAVCCYLAIF